MKMKKIIPIILLAALLLTACRWESDAVSTDPYTYSNGEKTLYVDPQAGTITCGVHTYRFEIDGDNISIIYPNGCKYIMTVRDGISYGGYTTGMNSTFFAENGYEDGDNLMAAVERFMPNNDGGLDSGGTSIMGVMCGVLICGIGLWSLLAPQSAWYVSHGWRYKDAEPSDAALAVESIVGIIAIVGGLIMIVVSL